MSLCRLRRLERKLLNFPETRDAAVAIDGRPVVSFARLQIECPPAELVGIIAGLADEFDFVQLHALFFGECENFCLEFSGRSIRTTAFVPLVSGNSNDDKKQQDQSDGCRDKNKYEANDVASGCRDH